MPTFAAIQDEVAAMLAIPDDDLDDDQRAALDSYLDELASLEADKVDGFAQFVKLESDHAESCKKEAQRLAAKGKAIDSRLGYLKSRYLATMQTNGLKKISGNSYTVSTRAVESVAVTADLDTIPDIYKRTKVEVAPDKAVIKEALKGGVTIPGCELVSSYSLQIR